MSAGSVATPILRAALALLVAFAGASRAPAQQNPTPRSAKAVDTTAFKIDPPGTYAQADLSHVLTSGNSHSSSLGFRASLTHRTRRHSLGLALGGLRASSTPGDRIAVGTPEDFELQTPSAVSTAEDYYVRGRHQYKTSDRFYGTTGAGWERNRHSGIENRWVLDVGFGYVLLAREWMTLRSAFGITYTDESYAASGTAPSAFVGARLGWDLSHAVLANTTLLHTLTLDQSFADAKTRRMDAQLGVQVAMTRTLGLKVNWRVLFNNHPPLTEVPLVGPDAAASALTVLVPYRKTDHGFSVSLVLSLAPRKEGE